MPRHASQREGGAPVIVRIAGLPLDAVGRFSTGLAADAVARVAHEERLRSARAGLEERLHAAVPEAPPELRRFLLAVKRDCHNARPLAAHARDPLWAALRERVGAAADDVVELEREGVELNARFEAAFAAELERQRRALLETLDDAGFRRALALASPGLSDALRAIRARPNAEHGRRERKAELALLRYVTRAAAKLSPFSTFTPVGVGVVGRDEVPMGVRLEGEPWTARSLVRIKRYLLHRVAHLLRRWPPFADGLRVELNDSLTGTSPGRFVYLRPHRWEPDPEGTLRFQGDALAAAGLGGPLLERLAALLSAERLTVPTLVDRLAAAFPASGEEGVRRHVERLLELGVLQLHMPWPVHEGRLEERLLGHLRTLPADPALDRLIDPLARLVALEDGFAGTDDPAASVRAIDRLIDEASEAAAALAGMDPAGVRAPREALYTIYEDVFLSPAPGAGRGPLEGVATVSRRAADAVLRDAGLVARLSMLMDHRHDFRHTLAAEARERWPKRDEVGALEVLQAVQPLWHDYMKVHLAHWRDKTDGVRTWNPRGLPGLEALHHWRSVVAAGLAGCVHGEVDEQRVDPEALRELLDGAPAEFTDAREWGAMAMVQPAAADGSLWVLNRLREGTGRYSARFTPAMDASTRAAYTAHLAARGFFGDDADERELLDVHCGQGDTINVHHPQTPALLTMPDDDAELPDHRRVRLGELRLDFRGPLPRLRGRAGRGFVPVSLGGAFEAYMPTLLKFLCLFGPSELGTTLPVRAARREGPLVVGPRVVLGSLVVHRRTWRVPGALLRELVQGRGDAAAFAAVSRFRAEQGLPERAFFWDREPQDHAFFRASYKPQYLDFTSPLFLPLLRGVADDGEDLPITELLPAPEHCPRDATGRRRAVEVQLDSLALRRPRRGAAAHGVRARRGHGAPVTAGG